MSSYSHTPYFVPLYLHNYSILGGPQWLPVTVISWNREPLWCGCQNRPVWCAPSPYIMSLWWCVFHQHVMMDIFNNYSTNQPIQIKPKGRLLHMILLMGLLWVDWSKLVTGWPQKMPWLLCRHDFLMIFLNFCNPLPNNSPPWRRFDWHRRRFRRRSHAQCLQQPRCTW